MKKRKFFVAALLSLAVAFAAIPSFAIAKAEGTDDLVENNSILSINDEGSSASVLRLGWDPRTYTISYVYTPRNTSVAVYIYNMDFSASAIAEADRRMAARVPSALKLRSATGMYNCHSYAWYSQSETNTYWMPSPAAYYTDGSYVESTGNVGDIICYFSSSGENLHSGIVVEKLSGTANNVCEDANLFTVESKWGDYGLYRHRGDECPYTSPYGGTATEVKFFTRYHSYTYTSNGASGHTKYCSDCEESVTEEHSYTYTYKPINPNVHTKTCKTCRYTATEGHTWSYFTTYFQCDYCNATAQNVSVILGLLPLPVRTAMVSKAWFNGETMSVNESHELLFYCGQFYLLAYDCMETLPVQPSLEVI